MIRDELIEHFIGVGMPAAAIERSHNMYAHQPACLRHAPPPLTRRRAAEPEIQRIWGKLKCGMFFADTTDSSRAARSTSIACRGQPPWYHIPGIGLQAINDCLTLKDAVSSRCTSGATCSAPTCSTFFT